MRRTILAVLAACGLASVFVGAQAPTPYKLGTFQRQGTTFIGIVIRDTQVINLQVANAAVSTGKRITAPTDMKDLIARYDNGVRQRISEIVNAVVTATTRPAYVIDLSALKVMPPIMYPLTMMNVAVNYREHAVEMAARGARPGDPPAGNALGGWSLRQGNRPGCVLPTCVATAPSEPTTAAGRRQRSAVRRAMGAILTLASGATATKVLLVQPATSI